MISNSRAILSVSDLNRRSKSLLETQLPAVWVRGEISNLSQPQSGHWYFSLKDDRAQIRCAMFASANRRCKINPQHGMEVLVVGKVSIYEGRGDYQLIAEQMEDAGLGALQKAFEQLKAKLQAEGLFDKALKQPLPKYPQRIGLITSATGAVVADMINIFKRRAPATIVTVFPAVVQGDQAVESLLSMLSFAQQQKQSQRCDLLIIGRGGGSLEDLLAFNNEDLVRAISASEIPVISAVGHDTDHCIADYCADASAATPSVAAEMASAHCVNLPRLISDYQQRFLQLAKQQINHQQRTLDMFVRALRAPQSRIQEQTQRLDYLNQRLQNCIQQQLIDYQSKLDYLVQRCEQQRPERLIAAYQQRRLQIQQTLNIAIRAALKSKNQQLQQQQSLLKAYSPLNVLGRGYSILLDDNHKPLSKVKQVKSGQQLKARLSDGTIDVKVE